MKIYKYNICAMNASFDPYILYHKLIKSYPNVKYYNPFDSTFIAMKESITINPLNGIIIENMFSGITKVQHDDNFYQIKLDINIEIYFERVMIFEFIYEVNDKKTHDVFLRSNKFINEILTWDIDGETFESSISAITNDFISKKIIPIHTNQELKSLLDNIDPTDSEYTYKYKRKLKSITGIDCDLCGSDLGLTTQNQTFNSIILDQENEYEITDRWEKMSSNYTIYKFESLYIIFDKKCHQRFLRDYKHYILYKSIISSYTVTFGKWFYIIRKETRELLENLKNKNEVYWSNLRFRVEEWQLHFLSQNTHRLASVSNLQRLKYFRTLNQKTENRWFDDLKQVEQEMYRNVDEIKYNLDNLSTPGHTHDEQSLQKETEKTNERILLLSFLAMSIPMLGAIFSPAFTLITKIISATVLCFLPILYYSIFLISKTRKKYLDSQREFKRNRKGLVDMVEYHKNNIQEIQNNDKIADDVKEQYTQWEFRNIKIAKNMLNKIDEKLI